MIPVPAVFSCPGCGRDDGSHPPLCQVAIRLVSADASASGAGWRERMLSAALYFGALYGSHWHPVARHYRCAAVDTPDTDDRGEPLVYAPADNLFRTE